jgi:hypothetical protein
MAKQERDTASDVVPLRPSGVAGSSASGAAAEVAATSAVGAMVARLLASTVEVVADFELIYEQPAVMRVVGEAARALTTVSEERDPAELSDALDALSVIVAALPSRDVRPGASEWEG